MMVQIMDMPTMELLDERLRQRAAAEPQGRGYVFLRNGETEAGSLSWGQLDSAARAVAARLAETCAPRDRALLVYPAGLDFIAAFVGCLYAGVVAVPVIAPRSAAHERAMPRLRGIIDDARPAVTLTCSAIGAVVEQVIAENSSTPGGVLPCVRTDELDLAAGAGWIARRQSSEDLAFLQYTSGSTAAPKGVMVSHGNLLHNLEMMCRAFHGSPQATGVSWLPHYHDMGLMMQLQPIHSGCRCVIMPPAAFLQKPMRWLQAISRYRAMASGGPNFAYGLCAKSARELDRAELDLSCWKLAYNAAEPIHARTMRDFATAFADCGFSERAFMPGYGLAEGTLLVSCGEYGEGAVIDAVDAEALGAGRVKAVMPDAPGARPLVSCGRVCGDQHVVIVDPRTHEPCAADEVGEVWLQGPSVAQGYWQNEDLTAEVFGAHLAGGEGPYLRTGDLGCVRDGELVITGRLKDVVIVRGVNHYPQDLELTVGQSHPALAEAGGAAFAVELDGQERLVVVHEVQRSQRHVEASAVAEAVRGALAERHELTLHALVLLKPGHLPRTSSGKVRRSACREAFLSGTLQETGRWERRVSAAENESLKEPVPAGGEGEGAGRAMTLEQMTDFLVQLLAEAAQCDPAEIDPGEPFVRYGLDSAAAVSLAEAIAAGIGERAESAGEGQDGLAATVFWDYPTIEALAPYLVERQQANLETSHHGRLASDAGEDADEKPAMHGVHRARPKANVTGGV